MTRVSILGSAALVTMLPALAFAQTSQAPLNAPTAVVAPVSDPLVAYRAYNEAVTAGKFDDAAAHATLAWQLAEAKWGASSVNTGGLAFNAVWSAALVRKSANRLDAARRAVELVGSSRDAYSLPEAQFLLAYAEYNAADEDGRSRLTEKLAAATLPIEGTWNDFLVINALLASANGGTGVVRGRTTIAIAERALVAINRLAPSEDNYRVLALLARAQGRLIARIDQDEAIADLVQARIAYGPMRSVDDKSWGSLAAWEIASLSVVTTLNNLQLTTGTRISRFSRRPMKMTEEEARRVNPQPGAPSTGQNVCEGLQRDRKVGVDISYPSGAARDYKVAGVLLRVDMTANGNVTNARLLGSVPPGQFGESALRAVSGWKFTVQPNLPTHCLKDKDIPVSFVIQ